MKKVTTLLALNETERLMLVEAIAKNLSYSVRKVQNNKTEKMSQLLETLNKQEGGFKITISESNLFYLVEALQWYGRMLQPNYNVGKMNKYIELAYIIDGRDKNLYLFGEFNPKQYTGNEKASNIEKYDFSQDRLMLIRFEKNKMEFIREFHRNKGENNENYLLRGKENMKSENEELVERAKNNSIFLNMQYDIIFFSDMKNYQFKKDYHYSV